MSAGQANGEYGFHFGSGTYAAAVIRVDVPDAGAYQDGYKILLRHALEIARRELRLLADDYAASLGKAGILIVLCLEDYHTVDVTQCFTKIRKEIENQRDLFWSIQTTVCPGQPEGTWNRSEARCGKPSGCAGTAFAAPSSGGTPRWNSRI